MDPHFLHPTHAEVDLSAFLKNLSVVRSLVNSRVQVLAVVKANAYGHGLVEIARVAEQNGVNYLGVARAIEGIELRRSGINCPILVFEVTPREHVEASLSNQLELTAVSVEDAECIASIATMTGIDARVHVKVDTGMGRLGIRWDSASVDLPTIALMRGITLSGIYSHFATAEFPDQSFANEQLARFQGILGELEKLKIPIPLRHMANSGAVLALPESHFDMVRPGIMLYGYAPRNGMPVSASLIPVMRLVTRVTFLKSIAPGTSVSYGRRYVAQHSTHIATIPIGYADGYSRLLTNKGQVIIRGKRYRIAGSVCMDNCMIDLGAETEVKEGDLVTVIGRDGDEQISAWDVAEWIGTIPYEVMCQVMARVPRSYSTAPDSHGT